MALCILLYVVGIVLMMGSDGQKYFQLRERKGLIDDGFNKYTRNPNYLGEILLYSSFAVLVNDTIVWCIMGYMWVIVFQIRMAIKDHSLSKKKGWEQYKD